MIKIRTLRNVDVDALDLLAASGYTSTAKYSIQKNETHEQTTIAMELVALDPPYVKSWPVLDDDVERYRQVVRQELSLGAYDDGQLVGIAIAERRDWNRTLWVMVCETQSTNVPAIEFYRKVGFEVEGIDLSYYSNDDAPDGEVANFMKRKLVSL